MIKSFVDRLFSNPNVRVLYRALLAGATVVYAADEPLTKGVLVAAVWTALEQLTPLNRSAGLFKTN